MCVVIFKLHEGEIDRNNWKWSVVNQEQAFQASPYPHLKILDYKAAPWATTLVEVRLLVRLKAITLKAIVQTICKLEAFLGYYKIFSRLLDSEMSRKVEGVMSSEARHIRGWCVIWRANRALEESLWSAASLRLQDIHIPLITPKGCFGDGTGL